MITCNISHDFTKSLLWTLHIAIYNKPPYTATYDNVLCYCA